MLVACDHAPGAAGAEMEAAPSSHHEKIAAAESNDSHEAAMPACHGAMEPEQDEAAVEPEAAAPVSPPAFGTQLAAAGCCTSGEGVPASAVALKSPSPTQLTDASLALAAAPVLEVLPPSSIQRPLRPPAPDGDPPGRLLVLHQAFLL